MTDPMRRLLMMAYHFPPVGGGVERSLKHATYLPQHGWQPVVIGPANSGYRIIEPASVGRIPADVEVHRTPTLEPAHLRRAVGWMLRRTTARGPTPNGGGGVPAAEPQSALQALRARANAAWAFAIPKLFFPDEQLLWIPGAILAGERAHRRSPVDAIYSSAPPISGHLAAAVLARHLGLPWIADFRDPWIGNAFAAPLPAVHRAAQRQLERWIVERADRTVFATSRWRERYVKRYPELAGRFVHIPNGYDPADLGAANEPPPRPDGPFQLIYAGSIYGERELGQFLDGLALAIGRGPTLRDRLRVEFVGWLSARNLAVAEARRPEFGPMVSFAGFRPRTEVIARERSADAGLILISDDPGRDADVNAKLYEYIGLDLPVLAVAPRGETRATLEELDWGVGADPGPEEIADGLAAIMALPRPDRPADPAGRYDRRRLARRLADLLDEIIDRTRRRS
jgi:glycosyltransferase involved in cell wall biosynthesis